MLILCSSFVTHCRSVLNVLYCITASDFALIIESILMVFSIIVKIVAKNGSTGYEMK